MRPIRPEQEYSAAATGLLTASAVDGELFAVEVYAGLPTGLFGHVGELLQIDDTNPIETTYEKGKHLGSGAYGEVFEASLRPHETTEMTAKQRSDKAKRHGAHHDVFDDQKFALKYLEVNNIAMATEAVMETLRLVRCQHDNIVGVREQFFYNRYPDMGHNERLSKSPLQLVIVLERCHGDLNDKIQDDWYEDVDPSSSAKLDIFSQMASAVQCIHDHGLIHRDLKPENIFLTNDGNVKVGDLGLAAREDSDGEKDGAGTSGYIAPELWKYCGSQFSEEEPEDYDHKVDVWSLGQILIDMSCVAIYTESGGNAAAYQILTAAPGVKVMDGDEDEGGDDGDAANAFIRDPAAAGAALLSHPNITACPTTCAVVEACLEVDPAKRLDCQELLEMIATVGA